MGLFSFLSRRREIAAPAAPVTTFEAILRGQRADGAEPVSVLETYSLDLTAPDYSVNRIVRTKQQGFEDAVVAMELPIGQLSLVFRECIDSEPVRDLATIRFAEAERSYPRNIASQAIYRFGEYCIKELPLSASVQTKTEPDGRIRLWVQRPYVAAKASDNFPVMVCSKAEHERELAADAETAEAASVAAELGAIVEQLNEGFAAPDPRYAEGVAAERADAEARLARETRAKELEAILAQSLADQGVAVRSN